MAMNQSDKLEAMQEILREVLGRFAESARSCLRKRVRHSEPFRVCLHGPANLGREFARNGLAGFFRRCAACEAT
jgi:hypothetical protein